MRVSRYLSVTANCTGLSADAQTAARLLVEEGLDYGPAKQRALKALGLRGVPSAQLPDNDLVEATRNDLLIQAYDINSIRVRLINIDRMRLTPAVLPRAFADHLDLLRAIRARNEADAVAAIERHIREARNRAVAF